MPQISTKKKLKKTNAVGGGGGGGVVKLDFGLLRILSHKCINVTVFNKNLVFIFREKPNRKF